MSAEAAETRNEKGQFRPGVSGNPAGRPKSSATKLLRALAHSREECGAEGETYAQRINRKLLELAASGDTRAMQIYYDRMEGRPRQSISVDTDEHDRRERKLQNFLAESEREGDPLTREEAIAVLAEEDSGFEDFE